MAEHKECPYRRLILWSCLQMTDESLLTRGLILFIVDNTSTKRVISPKLLSSKCNMYWRKVEQEEGKKATPTKASKDLIIKNLTHALGIVLSEHHMYRKRKSEHLAAKLHGWRCSEGKRKAENRRTKK